MLCTLFSIPSPWKFSLYSWQSNDNYLWYFVITYLISQGNTHLRDETTVTDFSLADIPLTW